MFFLSVDTSSGQEVESGALICTPGDYLAAVPSTFITEMAKLELTFAEQPRSSTMTWMYQLINCGFALVIQLGT